MQRYRINYHWLIGVFVSSLVIAIAGYFVWSWQVNRKAGYFLKLAEAALAEGEPQEALESLFKYVQLRPDETEARVKMAGAAVAVIKNGEATYEQRGRAYGILDQSVRVTNDAGSRRELAELMLFVRPQDAIEHVEILLTDAPNDSELSALLVQALYQDKDFDRLKNEAYRIIGYDRKTETFQSENVILQGEPEVYDLLSKVLVQKDRNPDLARRVIDQMVVANPDSPVAYLRKSQFLSRRKEFKAATEFLNKAYALDPSDDSILAAMSLEALGANYPGAKARYFEAMRSCESVLAEFAPDGSLDLDGSEYGTSKKEYLEAISELENANSIDEASEAKFEAARAQYAAARSKLAPADSIVQDDPDYKKALADLLEAESNFDEAQSDPEAAKGYITAGLEAHPESVLFYRLMAGAEQRLGQDDAALGIVNKGIDKLEKERAIELRLYKIDLLFEKEDYPEIEREIEHLVQTNRRDIVPIIDLQRARILFRQHNWAAAAKELKRVRPLLFERSRSKFQSMAGAMLGVSYESLGYYDLALQAYETVLTDDPGNPAAQKGHGRMLAKIAPEKRDDDVELDDVIAKTLELPEDEQDWSKVDELVAEVIAEHQLPPANQKLLRAKVLIRRGKYAAAKDLIRQAAQEAPDDVNIHFAAVVLVASDPEQGPEAAMQLLDRLESKWGRSLQTRAQRADLLVAENGEDVTEQLRLMMTDVADLSEAELLSFTKILGLKFEQLGKLAEAREFYEKSAELEPNNLPILMHLFDLGLRQQDDAAMQKAQEAILAFVKSKNNASYALNEVKRRIMSFSRGEIDRVELATARKLLDAALVQRPRWHELHITYGQLLLLLNEDMELALKYFDDALEYGPPKSNAVGVQIKLLAQQGLYREARDRMERLRPEIRGRLLGQLEAEILTKTGDPEEGFAAAKKLAAAQLNNPATQLWYSKLSQQMGELDVAVSALRRALEKNPSSPENWLRLVGLHVEQKNIEAIEGVLREAHLASNADALPILTAKKHELSSNWQMAEDIYLAYYAGNLDDLSVSRRVADFYLFWSQKEEANLGKAATYINRILRAANEGKAAADDPNVIWARQKAAQMLFAKQDYQQSLKAERLLRQGADGRVISRADSELLTDILIARRDPQSLQQALELLTKLRKTDQMSKKGGLQLARLLSQADQGARSKSLMLELISKYPSDVEVRVTYIDLLLNAGEYSQAESVLKRLRDIAPTSAAVVELSVRLAAESGDQAQVNRLLTSLLPKMGGAMTADELKTVLSVAQTATRHGAIELAGQLYETYARRVPTGAIELARFLAYHGDCDRAVELMKRLYADQTDDVVQLANRMISVRRDEIGDKYDEDVDRIINAALREDPDSISRQLSRAEAFDAEGKYDESIAAYEKLLRRDDLPTRVRAAAMNNLGFLLALLNQRVDDAERLIDQAMETFGPVGDMLDTRAIVRMAQGKYDLAIEDMELALTMSRDPVKYFHLAKAYILAGDGQAANKAWEKAQELGFKKESLPKLEKSQFEKIRQEIESFQAQNVKL